MTGARRWRRSTKRFMRAGKPILKQRWDERPIAPPRLAYEVWEAIKKEDWLLVAGAFRGWPQPSVDLGQARACFSAATAAAVWAMVPRASVGASLPYRGTGKICVNLQRDGEMLYTPSAMWTRGQYRRAIVDGNDQQSRLL